MPPRKRIGRKLLVASLGVASVSYVACGQTETTGNLVAPHTDGSVQDSANPGDARFDQLVANLVAPPEDAPFDQLVANLVPPPQDAGLDGDAKD